MGDWSLFDANGLLLTHHYAGISGATPLDTFLEACTSMAVGPRIHRIVATLRIVDAQACDVFVAGIRSATALRVVSLHYCVVANAAWLRIRAALLARSVREMYLVGTSNTLADALHYGVATVSTLYVINVFVGTPNFWDHFGTADDDDGDDTAVVLALANAVPAMPMLRRVYLSECTLGVDAENYLAAALTRCARLDTLHLSNVISENDYASLAARLPAMRLLRVLKIEATHHEVVRLDVATLLAAATHAPRLDTLHLDGLGWNVATPVVAAQIAAWLREAPPRRLGTLSLEDARFVDDDVWRLVTAALRTSAPLDQITLAQEYNDTHTLDGARNVLEMLRATHAWPLDAADTRSIHRTVGAYATSVLRRFTTSHAYEPQTNAALRVIMLYRDASHDAREIQAAIDTEMLRRY